MSGLPWLDPYDDEQPFPDPQYALLDPDGLLAVGGSLAPQRLLRAYRLGIFPWYSDGQPILWWSPNPRTVLFPENVKISRSLRKILRRSNGGFQATADRAFDAVVRGCAAPRQGDSGTWITPEMNAAYRRLHKLGFAHSIEVWHGAPPRQQLVGGLYGVALGRVFYGESMFSFVSNASKIALVTLCWQLARWRFAVIDCQMHTRHLHNLGAEDIPREHFNSLLERYCRLPGPASPWQLDDDLLISQQGPAR